MEPSIRWIAEKNIIEMIDQTKLPGTLTYLKISDYRAAAKSIKDIAPAIGVTAAMGMALAAIEFQNLDIEKFKVEMENAAQIISKTRPTAVNLTWAIKRIQKLIENNPISPPKLTKIIILECQKMWQEDIDTNRTMGKYGATLLEDGDTVLTHCNAGSLATVQYGTALAPIRWAIEEEGKKIQVIADETRPRLQGARLTAWELHYDKIPVKVEVDNNAGLMMRLGKINKVIVGADRIVNGVVFNKIGTFMVAMAAKYHNIPMYVVAPKSTLSLNESEKDVIIEQRNAQFEVAEIMGKIKEPIVPDGVECINYAFDATPFELITKIITQDGVFSPEELIQKYK
ncbi:MAG: S-methyl-5-thioribose-1-phosphate isomerase [Promethearchaeota archaeon]